MNHTEFLFRQFHDVDNGHGLNEAPDSKKTISIREWRPWPALIFLCK